MLSQILQLKNVCLFKIELFLFLLNLIWKMENLLNSYNKNIKGHLLSLETEPFLTSFLDDLETLEKLRVQSEKE